MLDWAASQVGTVEGPRNNETVYGEFTGYNFQPWCGSFIMYGFDQIGLKGEPSSVYTPSGASAYKTAGRWIERNGPAQPGDIVYFDWGGSTMPSLVDHVGIVSAVNSDGSLVTIEGNTSPTDAGSQSNGGGVYRRRRPRSVIAGFGRPNYTIPAPTPTPANPDPSEDEEMTMLIAPDGSIWSVAGVWRTSLTVSPPEATKAYQVHAFLGGKTIDCRNAGGDGVWSYVKATTKVAK
jgi:hypothetical protein